MRRKLIVIISALAVASITAALPAGAAVSGGSITAADCPGTDARVVMCGLDNPRGLAFGPEGALYVAEAGRGGFGLENWSCAPYPTGYGFTGQVGGSRCYGPTGAISRLWHGVQERVATGFPSQARSDNGRVAIGPHDIAMLGPGSAHVTIGLQQPPDFRITYPFLSDFARLAQVEPSGVWRLLSDLGAYEADANPDEGPLDTNPYGLLALPGGHVVADAGGNSLLRVEATGVISTLAVFQSEETTPPRTIDSVPTAVAVGPDGAYYVGELGGFVAGGLPVAGAAHVYRVARDEPPPLFPLYRTEDACLEGFTTIIDVAFDEDGNLYVLQYGPGTLVRVTRDAGAAGGICAQYQGTPTPIVTGLSQPTSVAVGPDGALYVTNHGNFPEVGEVLRIEP
jgi:hypothetical protein